MNKLKKKKKPYTQSGAKACDPALQIRFLFVPPALQPSPRPTLQSQLTAQKLPLPTKMKGESHSPTIQMKETRQPKATEYGIGQFHMRVPLSWRN